MCTSESRCITYKGCVMLMMYEWKQVYYLQGLCYVNDVRVKAGVLLTRVVLC